MNAIQKWIAGMAYDSKHNQLKRYMEDRNISKDQIIGILKKREEEADAKEKEIRAKIKALDDERLRLTAKFDDGLSSNVILRVIERKDMDKRGFLRKAWDFVSGSDSNAKIGGHIMHFNNNMEMTWFDILSDDVDNLFKVKKKNGEGEAYMLQEYFGSHKGKKLFLTKFPYAISLKLVQERFDMETDGTEVTEKEPDLAYDCKGYYNLLEHTIKRNITKGEPGGFDLMKTLADYWIYLVIIGLGLFLFLTPQGKQLMMQVAASLKLK
jgi:hypothetical protein